MLSEAKHLGVLRAFESEILRFAQNDIRSERGAKFGGRGVKSGYRASRDWEGRDERGPVEGGVSFGQVFAHPSRRGS
jgi:hypothetical protein